MDIEPQPRYPFEFMRAEVLAVLRHIKPDGPSTAIHVSPPCQAYTNAQKIRSNEHPDLIPQIRGLLNEIGLPYIIENVPGSPLLEPIELCGAMFGLRTYRHRLFESNLPLVAPAHSAHAARNAKMGRRPKPGEFMHVVGNFSGVAEAKKAMGIDWMTRDWMLDEMERSAQLGKYVEQTVEDPETGGRKGQKLARFDMIPSDVLWELAEHYGKGESKYPSDETGLPNWQRGYDWRLSVAALQRHLHSFLQGEDEDPETGSSHLTAVMWHAIALRWFQLHGKGHDFR